LTVTGAASFCGIVLFGGVIRKSVNVAIGSTLEHSPTEVDADLEAIKAPATAAK
jgi:hypothetical protein